ncbi:voltage-gated potassium channel subunit beta-1-like [Pyrgilauda ruficollis]|uniref:voltage-gated potassium channel subunit beta-1-like n=1 Tax=Pyrgilauda ruficollis TaxID=221976 RepID=UPI001B86FF68|nr:voltage-gated potassium channel subunit beta-1-like [Pyrgilauda ruficollis]
MHLYKAACADMPRPRAGGRRAGETPRARSAAPGWPRPRSPRSQGKQLERFLQLHGLGTSDSARQSGTMSYSGLLPALEDLA